MTNATIEKKNAVTGQMRPKLSSDPIIVIIDITIAISIRKILEWLNDLNKRLFSNLEVNSMSKQITNIRIGISMRKRGRKPPEFADAMLGKNKRANNIGKINFINSLLIKWFE